MQSQTAERRKQARIRRRARKAIELAERKAREEAAAEVLAPAIQRHGVDGLRGPRWLSAAARTRLHWRQLPRLYHRPPIMPPIPPRSPRER